MYASDDPPDEVVPDEEATKPGVGLDSQSARAPRVGHRLKGSAKTAELGKLNVAPAGLPVGSLYAVGDGVLSDGSPFHFSDLVGKVSLVVNVALQMGKTGVTYAQLADLRKSYGGRGLEILAFPSNDFRQEPGSDAEISDFVRGHFPELASGAAGFGEPGGQEFTLFAKTRVSRKRDPAANLHPVYENLLAQLPSESDVGHNFFKYLVSRSGVAVARFDKKQDPLSFEAEIADLLDK
eukprot:CAMPEP_0172624860 /NCGR_PEP_ID=MMETSP1068-20121228/139734_1 /TAXON_ID=35684 /ORGANISM="Pseudopedinella elastica, Strain CCMP716" /LENGTH=236 /DNA_ID=CAMNT_0013433959 /DNA_START=62 /DNA_END=772 /DNA_ORIENTATION=-